MSRRSQVTRRRNYGRRQHEVRQRRDGVTAADWPAADWTAELTDAERSPASRADEGQLPGSIEAGRQ